MIPENNKKRFEELIEQLKQLFSASTTRAKLIITAEKTTLEEDHAYADDLKNKPSPVKNIQGETIY